MAGPTAAPLLVFDDAMTGYDFGPGHPMNPVRLRLTMRLADQLGVLERFDVVPPAASEPGDAEVLSVHTQDYVEAVRRCSADPGRSEPSYGLGTTDDPCFAGMHEASARVVRAGVDAADAVWSGERTRAVSIAGGLHHAMPDRASGFCVYNDVAAAIRRLLELGAERVAYVDTDVHHGDGVQACFYDDPRVLTISLHESPMTLFPGTGLPTETGGPHAPGSAVNVALPPATSDAGWLRAFHAVVPDALDAFAPQVLLTQHGCDSHVDDPLAHLALTVDGQRAGMLALRELAERHGGRWLAFGGGGYAVVRVVPRAWTHLLAIVASADIDPPTPIPTDWRIEVAELTGRSGPDSMTDGGDVAYAPVSAGLDPGSRLDQAVMATREAAFPPLGLTPEIW